MVIDIKMCRFENVPWGFRLVGGSDFEYPLTVVKVTEGSIAEEAGLRVGDVIVRINDAAASPLTHDEANQIIKHCGNVFYFGIYREHEDPENVPKYFPINEPEENLLEPMPAPISPSYCKSPVPFEHQINSNGFYHENVTECDEVRNEELSERAESVMSENTEIKLVEEEIAAVLSGETEVLKEHNVLGIFPKPGVCMSSDVLRTLNAEAIKTKAEKDLENKKWTTFLQKPDRPIPKSKQQLEAERRAANAYKVQIVKSAPRTPERAISPSIAEGVTLAPVAEDAREPDLTIKAVETPKPSEPEVEEPIPTDTEVPNLEESIEELENQIEIENKSDEKVKCCYENGNETENGNVQENGLMISEQKEVNDSDVVDDNLVEVEQEKSVETITEKTAEEIALERQLADVQKQLEALSTLPSTIQATLDAVTKQLAVLLPTFKLQQQQQQQHTEDVVNKDEVRHVYMEMGSEDEEHANCVEFQTQNDEETDANDAVAAAEEFKKESQSALNAETHTNGLNAAREPQTQPSGMETANNEEQQQMKKQKVKHDVIEELEEHLERKSNPRRSKRLFGPLTPSSERPLVLPGGRRWYRPKDAFNDEFIAETLSAQAELITGTTLGGVYESTLLPFDPRVNFMKYQKPERKIDLNRSEVYKVIHHLDRQPVRGIEVRPSMVPAEVDIRKAVQSV